MKAIYKAISFLLVALLLFPASVEFAHIFSGHEHHYCNHYSDAHFHQKSQDCSLFQFHQNSFSSPDFISFVPFSDVLQQEKDESNYNFLSTQLQLPFRRRGPPENMLS